MSNSPNHHLIPIDHLVARDRHPREAQEILETFYDKLDDHDHPHVPAEYLRWSYEMHLAYDKNAEGKEERVISRFGLRVACGDTHANKLFFGKRFFLSQVEDELPEEVHDRLNYLSEPCTPQNTPHICMIEAPYFDGGTPREFLVLAGFTYPSDNPGLLVTPVRRRKGEQELGVYMPEQHTVSRTHREDQAFYGKLQRAEDGAIVRDGKLRHRRLTEDEVRQIVHGITIDPVAAEQDSTPSAKF
jgi:hypothetical protein